MHPATMRGCEYCTLTAILPSFTGGEVPAMGGEAKGEHVFPGELQRETLQENGEWHLPNLDLFSVVKFKDQTMLCFSFGVLCSVI